MNDYNKNEVHIGCAMALVLGVIYVLIWFAIYSLVAAGLMYLLTIIAPTVTFSIKLVLVLGGLLSILRFIL